jgi:two-component system, cell cycle sensor histidine kinase and response regulator CckA
MTIPLRVLVIEDLEDDMLLMLRELRRGGYTLNHLRVETPEEMAAALDRQPWDIVIADYTLPLFSAPEALKLLQHKQIDLPFIIVSGTISEETAVMSMKAGAHDYMTKGNLIRLLPAVERELREAEERRRRQDAESALQESETALWKTQQQYQALSEASPVGIFRTDVQSNCIYVNQRWCDMTGISSAQTMQEGWAIALHPEDSHTTQEAWHTAFQNRQPFKLEFRFQRPDGSIVWVLGQALPEEGELGYIGTITDITEKKQMESQLLRTQRLESLGTLASGIAHDFNNILTPILAISQLLSMKLSDDDANHRHLLELLEGSARRGADLVKQILVFARGGEGKRVPVQIESLLAEVVQMMQQTFSKAIELQLDLPDYTLWQVSADMTQLHQVLMNLAVNARDAMPTGGRLQFSAENKLLDETAARLNLAEAGAYVMITVADNGSGIPPELLERIFDPFVTTKEVGKGTGLGLSTTLGIIRNHGGFIKVHSQVMQGSQFSIYLPRLRDIPASIIETTPTMMGHDELLLIVEDEPAIQEVATVFLEDCNYRVLTASDGMEAIALYQTHQQDISLVLMDITMPSLDGVSAIHSITQLNPQVKIIAMSGLATHSQLTATFGQNVKAFLPKPYTMQELLQTLWHVMNNH